MPGARPRRLPAPHGRGFTLVEMATVVAIISVLLILTVGAFTKIKDIVSRRSMVTDLYSQLILARNRARAAERMQIVVIDAVAGTNNTYGYYYYDDFPAQPPSLYGATELNTLVTAMTALPVVPGGYFWTLRDSRVSPTNGYYLSTDAWDGPLPVPWTPLSPGPGNKLDTSTSGCSFCSGGIGAVGFLPSGKVVFSDGNTTGGFIVLQGESNNPGNRVRSGIGISTLGFIQQVEHQ